MDYREAATAPRPRGRLLPAARHLPHTPSPSFYLDMFCFYLDKMGWWYTISGLI